MAYEGYILWSSVSRDGIVLAEAGSDPGDGSVINLAQKLVKKKPTPGWEFERSRKSKLQGIKFHVFDGPDKATRICWVFACVADSSLETAQVKSFLEKIVYLTEPMRQDSPEWREGGILAAQKTFAPTLLQRMEQVAYQGRLAMVNQQVNSAKEIMADNIELMLARDEKLEEMNDRATALNSMSKQFKKRTQEVKRFQMWQNAKHGLMIGSAVTAGVAVVTVPPLIALL